MPRPLSTHEVGGVSRQSLTEVDLSSWPKENPPATQDPPKIHKAEGTTPLQVIYPKNNYWLYINWTI